MLRRLTGVLSILLSLVVTPIAAATRTWTGAANTLWSVGGNWTGGVAPVDGDSLLFPVNAPNPVIYNDIAGLDLTSVSLQANYTIGGHGITLSDGLTAPCGREIAWNVPITLARSQTFDACGVDFGNTIAIEGRTLTLSSGVRVSGAIVGTGAVIANRLTISGNSTFNGTLTMNTGDLVVTGSMPNATIIAANSLIVTTGALGNLTLTDSQLEQGNGLFTKARIPTGSFAMHGGYMHVDLEAGDKVGSDFDQIAVTGTVSLSDTELQPNCKRNFPVPGTERVIIANDGTDPVIGTFRGLPEGAIVMGWFYYSHPAAIFRITYAGGDGNDVALIRADDLYVWTGAIDETWSAADNWADGLRPKDGATYYFPETGSSAVIAMRNDLVGLDVIAVKFAAGHSYTANGNAITLAAGIANCCGGPVTWNIPMTLTASQTFDTKGMNLAAPLYLAGHTLTFISSARISGPLFGSGEIVVSGGELAVTATIGNANVTALAGTILSGNGILPSTTLSGATLRPKAAAAKTAVLSTASLTMTNSILEIDIDDGQHDRVDVTGTVTLDDATLQVLLGDIPPVAGTTRVILDNDGTDPIRGTFAGLPEGANVRVGSSLLRITYAGGTGNDIALTAVSVSRKSRILR